MDSRLQSLVLAAVVAVVGYGAAWQPATKPASPEGVSSQGGPVAALSSASGNTGAVRMAEVAEVAETAIAGVEDVLGQAEAIERQRQDVERRNASARARQSVMRERARQRVDAMRENSIRALDARIVESERRNEALAEDAAKREAKAIELSHATVGRRNREQWDVWSEFLATTVLAQNPPSPT